MFSTSFFMLNLFCLLIAARDSFSQLMLSESISPVFILFVFSSVAVLSSWVLKIIQTKNLSFIGPLIRLSRTEKGNLLKLGLITWVTYASTIFGISFLGAGAFNLIDFTIMPVLTVVSGVIMLKENISRNLKIGSALSLLGVLVFLGTTVNTKSSAIFETVMGFFLAVVSAASSSVNFTIQKKQVDSGLTPYEILMYRFPIPAVLMGVWILISGTKIDWNAIVPLAMIGFFGFTFPLLLMCSAFAKSSIGRFSSFLFLIPLYTFALNACLFSEELNKMKNPLVIGGVALTLIGFLLSEGHLKFNKKQTRNKRIEAESLAAKILRDDLIKAELNASSQRATSSENEAS